MDGSQRISNVSQQSGDFAIKDNAPLTDATAELSQENIDVSELEQKFTQARYSHAGVTKSGWTLVFSAGSGLHDSGRVYFNDALHG
jgi:hypothetical protein